MKKIFRKIKTARKIFRDNGISGLRIPVVVLDMIYCKKRYCASYEEYLFYGYQNLKNKVRKNFLLQYHQRARYDLVDNDHERKIWGKENQYKFFCDMIHREWIRVDKENPAELEAFIKKHRKVIFKPILGTMGKGIFAFTAENYEKEPTMAFSMMEKKDYICEQYVDQHPQMASLNPNSVNTIRIITLYDGNTVKFVSAGLRTGAKDEVCDNMSIGGIGAAVDIETGIIFTNGVDFKKVRYDNHPASNTKILGFQVPYWQEVKCMVEECARRAHKTAIVGWDIAIAQDGPCLIESNNRPASRLVQIATGKPTGEDIIKFIDDNWRKYHDKLSKRTKRITKQYKKLF